MLSASNHSTLMDELQNLIALDTKLTNTCFILFLSASICFFVRLEAMSQSNLMFRLVISF